MIKEDNSQEQCILACLDGAHFTESVCDYALWLGLTLKKPVQFIHVIEHGQYSGPTDYSGTIGLGASEDLLHELAAVEESRSKLIRKQGQFMLAAAQEKANAMGISSTIVQCHGTLAERVVELESDIYMAVIGIRGVQHEHDQAALGAQIETLVRSIYKPILVVNQIFNEPQTFMLAYDGSQAAEKALEFVGKWQALKSAHWIIARAGTHSDGDISLQKAETVLSKMQFTQVRLESRLEKPEVGLSNCQKEFQVDITVMGAYSHHPLRGFLFGSFTEKMLRQTQKPLLLVR